MGKTANSWENTNEPQQKVSSANEVTRIPAGTEIRQGILISTDDIRIDGRFFGKIISKGKVILGEKAIFNGELYCENADIYGFIEGKAVVGDVLSLLSSCSVQGNIQIVKLSVENGAKFDGNCQIISKEEFNKMTADFADRLNKECPPTVIDTEKKSNKVKVDFAVADATKAI